MAGKKMGLRTKVNLLVSLFMLTTNLALGFTLMRQSHNATKTQINERIAKAAPKKGGFFAFYVWFSLMSVLWSVLLRNGALFYAAVKAKEKPGSP